MTIDVKLEESAHDQQVNRWRRKTADALDTLSEILYENGLFYKSERIGLGGKKINVYKVKTMNDRGTLLPGKLYAALRNTGIDELPQTSNIVRGEMNFIGLRSLDSADHEILPLDLQEARKKHAALVNVAYAYNFHYREKKSTQHVDFRNTAERQWLTEYELHPIRTYVKTIAKIGWKIVTNQLKGLQ